MSIILLVPLICAGFCVIFFFYFRWYINRRTSASELFEEYRESRLEVNRLIADIDSVTDRDLQLVEDRIKKLKDILDEADKRIAVLTRELERSRSGGALYTNLGRGIRAAINTPYEPSPPLDTRGPSFPAVLPAEAQAKPAQPVQPLPAAIMPAQAAPSAQSKTPSKRQIRSQIETMAKEGLAPGEIASRLGISLSEVDLAMNLLGRNKR